MSTTYRSVRTGPQSKADWTTWAGNSIAFASVVVAIIAGAVGMMVAFGYANEDSTAPFRDGLAWMFGGLVVAIVANVFRREHHIVRDDEGVRDRSFAGDLDLLLGNSLGVILGALAVTSALIGLLVHFEVVNEGNVNPLDDAIIWFTAGGILAFCATTFRREPHVSDHALLSGDRHTYETKDTPERGLSDNASDV